jgi:hypothetical protein
MPKKLIVKSVKPVIVYEKGNDYFFEIKGRGLIRSGYDNEVKLTVAGHEFTFVDLIEKKKKRIVAKFTATESIDYEELAKGELTVTVNSSEVEVTVSQTNSGTGDEESDGGLYP